MICWALVGATHEMRAQDDRLGSVGSASEWQVLSIRSGLPLVHLIFPSIGQELQSLVAMLGPNRFGLHRAFFSRLADFCHVLRDDRPSVLGEAPTDDAPG